MSAFNVEKASKGVVASAGSGDATTYEALTAIASVELANGFTYTYFYDNSANSPTLSYLYGPSDDTTYNVRSVQTVGASEAVTNNDPAALTATQEGNNVRTF